MWWGVGRQAKSSKLALLPTTLAAKGIARARECLLEAITNLLVYSILAMSQPSTIKPQGKIMRLWWRG